jgi:uncharacterized protein (DUF2267 family)
MPTSDTETFVRAVAARTGGFDSLEGTLAACNAVLGELGAYVSGAAAERLAASLPDQIGSALSGASKQAEGGESRAFIAGVAARERVDPASAGEHVQAVFRAVAQMADPEAVRAVRDQLTPELRVLLADETEDDTSDLMSGGTVDPDAPKVAGPDRPVEP